MRFGGEWRVNLDSKVIEGLEEIARLAQSSADAAKISAAIGNIRDYIRIDVGASLVDAQKLENELSTWQSKIDVILKEPVGRQGLAKHARYWAGKLKNVG